MPCPRPALGEDERKVGDAKLSAAAPGRVSAPRTVLEAPRRGAGAPRSPPAPGGCSPRAPRRLRSGRGAHGGSALPAGFWGFLIGKGMAQPGSTAQPQLRWGAHAFSPPRRSVRPAGRGVWGGSSPGTRSVGAPQSPTCDRAAPPAVPICPPGVEQRGPCSPRGRLPPPAPCSPPPLPNFTGAPRGAAGASRGAHGHSPPGDAHPFSWGGGEGHHSNTCWAAPGKFKQPKKVSLGAGGALIFRQILTPLRAQITAAPTPR